MKFVPRRVTAAIMLGASSVLFTPFALAHARPKVMVPAADSTVSSPTSVSVTFTETVEGKFSSLRLTNEQGRKINTVSAVQLPNDPKTLTLALPTLPPGGYLVQWVSVAADGHRMEGEYKFTVK
jgi:methionine-rich copper-binding protein CopC